MYDIGAFYCQLFAGIREGAVRDIDEAFTSARSHGITKIDFSSREINDGTSSLLSRTGMSPASVHGSLVCKFDTREDYIASLDNMKRAVNKALSIGSPYFMCVPLDTPDMPSDKRDDFKKHIRELFCDICDYSKQLPIIVTVENFSRDDIPYSTPEDIKWLLDNIPSLMFTYDSGNFSLAGHDEIEGLKKFIDRTVYVHLKDLKVTDGEGILRGGVVYDSLELGGGFVRNAEALKMLKSSGYLRGTVTIEVNSELNRFSRTLESVKWLRDTLANL